MIFSSTPRICALAESSDHVRRRRFFTFSITSGQSLLKPATSKVARSEAWLAELLASLTTSAPPTSFTAFEVTGAASLLTFAAGTRFASAVAGLT